MLLSLIIVAAEHVGLYTACETALQPFTSRMKLKLKFAGMLVAHTGLSVLSVGIAGLASAAVLGPILGNRYSTFAHSVAAFLLCALVAGFYGFVLFGRWHDKAAFFAWLIPCIVALHLFLIRGLPSIMEFRGAVPVFEDWAWDLVSIFLPSGIAYSAGALLASTTVKRPPVTVSSR